MMPSGRWAQVVKPNGTLVHTSQYCVEGMTLILTRMPASFHCSTMVCTASGSQARLRPADDLDVDAVRVARLREQLLRLGDVAL